MEKERRKKCLKGLAIILAIIVVIVIITIIIKIVTKKNYYKNKSGFTTTDKNEEIQLLNYKAIKGIAVQIKINGKKS